MKSIVPTNQAEAISKTLENNEILELSQKLESELTFKAMKNIIKTSYLDSCINNCSIQRTRQTLLRTTGLFQIVWFNYGWKLTKA
jgi:hypothetical protein